MKKISLKYVVSCLILLAPGIISSVDAQTCIAGDCKNGWGKWEHFDKSVTEAEFVDSKYDYGRRVMPDKSMYEGSFEDEWMKGIGIWQSADKKTWKIGKFKGDTLYTGYILTKKNDKTEKLIYKIVDPKDSTKVLYQNFDNFKTRLLKNANYRGHINEQNKKHGIGYVKSGDGSLTVGIFQNDSIVQGYRFLKIASKNVRWNKLQYIERGQIFEGQLSRIQTLAHSENNSSDTSAGHTNDATATGDTNMPELIARLSHLLKNNKLRDSILLQDNQHQYVVDSSSANLLDLIERIKLKRQDFVKLLSNGQYRQNEPSHEELNQWKLQVLVYDIEKFEILSRSKLIKLIIDGKPGGLNGWYFQYKGKWYLWKLIDSK
ncbi:MAG: hypothetical protein KBF75_10750 [Saprospiraceae bacterium]|jgi:hypothetical protein|nr:hypothetical protein [Saprospiraceae bacterium]MCA0334389.1 hypothetical protein [Bacteroidota bacterium]